MPRVRRRTGAVCAAHGDRCKLGGGSGYVSAFCHEDVPPCRVHGTGCRLGGGRGPVGPFCEPVQESTDDPELAELLAEDRAAADGITTTEAAARMAADRERAAARWARLTCQQVDAELAVRWHGRTTRRDGEDAALAELVAADGPRAIEEATQARLEADRVAAELAARVELEPASTDKAELAATGPQERPSGVVVPLPTPDAAEPPRPRKGRRRVASVASIDTYGIRDNGYNDPFRGDY